MDLNNEVEEPRTTSKKLNVLGNFCADTSLPLNMTCKKDSGYGSQGQIKLEKLLLPDSRIPKQLCQFGQAEHSFDSSDASETDSPSSGFSIGSPSMRPVIIPKDERELAQFYDRLNLQ